jgi:transcription initiation factor TFIIIB Brf1 subunit/transcription initiation factor TFIIB
MTVVYYPETQNEICEQCGVVASENTISHSEVQFSKEDSHMLGQSLTHEEGMIGGLLVSNGYGAVRNVPLNNQSEQRNVLAKRKCMSKTEQIMSNLNIPNQHLNETFGYICKIADKKFTKFKFMDDVIATCVYCVARRHNLPITFLDLSECLGVSVYQLGRKYREYSQLLGFTVTTADPTELLDITLSNLPLAEDIKSDIYHLSFRLLRIAKTIGEGRRPIAITGAAISIACDARKLKISKKSIADVCHMSVHAISERVKEIQSILVKAMSSLAYGKKRSEEENTKCYLDHLGTTISWLETQNKLAKSVIVFLPPSFVKAREMRENRMARISSAKSRIQSILENKFIEETLDKEDLEIQRLILSGMKEEDILNGQTRVIKSCPSLEEEIGELDIPESKMEEFIKSPLEVKRVRELEDFTTNKKINV